MFSLRSYFMSFLHGSVNYADYQRTHLIIIRFQQANLLIKLAKFIPQVFRLLGNHLISFTFFQFWAVGKRVFHPFFQSSYHHP